MTNETKSVGPLPPTSSTRLYKLQRLGFSSLIAGFLSSCASITPPSPPPDIVAQFPDSLPSTTITSFSPALVCMDDMMVAYNRAPIYITSAPISNMTNERSVSSGSTEMLISAVSRMAIRSKGVRYVTFEPAIQNVMSLQGAHPDNADFRVPDYFIRGGLTQINKSFWNGQRGVGASVEIDPGDVIDLGTFFQIDGQEDITSSVSSNAGYGTLSVDLNAGYVASLEIIPGASSSNTLALRTSHGNAMTGDISVSDLGLSFTLTETFTRDMNTVLRALLEVGAIELIGKLHGLPYGRCLLQAGVNEERDADLLARYLEQSTNNPDEIVRAAQQALKDMGYYNRQISGQLDVDTEEALRVYQIRMGLLSTGAIGFDTFRALNSYTPARDEPYVSWWHNDRAVTLGKVTTVPTSSDDSVKNGTSTPSNTVKPSAEEPAGDTSATNSGSSGSADATQDKSNSVVDQAASESTSSGQK